MQTKLTLRVEEAVIRRAKALAKNKGKSVSQMVSEYFTVLGAAHSEGPESLTPLVRSLKGVLRSAKVDREDYRRHLEDKYL